MTMDGAIDLIRECLMLMLLVSSPILAAALLIGLAISVIQAVTQVQEQTLSFVPKIVGMAIVTIFAAPWMTKVMMEFATRMFGGH
jgi:flagellar biosynthesis protein FliQ